MNKYIDCFSHITVEAPYYQRPFERDLILEDEEGWQELGKRVILLVMPLISLYQPCGVAISISMGSCRILTHLNGIFHSGGEGEIGGVVSGLAQGGIAALALAGTLFSLTLGLVISTGADLTLSAGTSLHHLIRGDYSASFEEGLQVLTGVFYLATMFTGTLEIILASLVLQAFISFYQARHEFTQEKLPETCVKMFMGVIRCHQALQMLPLIQKRDALLAQKELQALYERALNGKRVWHLIQNPLNDLALIAEKSVILSDAKGKTYDFGSHFHGYGKEIVKGANLSFRTKIIEGREVTELDFKVNHVFRDRIKHAIQEIETLQKAELKETLAFANSHIKDITIEKVPFEISENLVLGKACKITFEGVGSLMIGASSDYPNLYDRVIVRIDAGKNLYDLHEMLAFVRLDDVIRMSTDDELQRLKMGHLFRTFFPKDATAFERTDAFFDLSLDALKAEMIQKAPGIQEIFERYLDQLEVYEILPGRVRYRITGFAAHLHELGARALIASITGAKSQDETFDRVASIIKMGMLSSETRYSNEMSTAGLSPTGDFITGGADSVYTQLLTKADFERERRLSDFYYYGSVQVLFSLEVLETGTYQYYYDSFGFRRTGWDYYENRPSIVDFISKQNAYFFPENEVMVKERIAPNMIKGLIVRDMEMRSALVKHLKLCDLVQQNAQGVDTILGICIDDFIRTSHKLTPDLIS